MNYKELFYALGTLAISIVLVAGLFFLAHPIKKSPLDESTKKTDEELAKEKVTKGDDKEKTDKTMNKNQIATWTTNKGTFKIELFEDQMPITTANFIKLAKSGFYDNSKFHRIIDGFMVQGGDPNSKSANESTYGTGGPGYTIKDEFVKGLSNVRGTIAMANTGQPNSGGSQFFINLVDNVGLDFDKPPMESSHPVFGKVISGMDVVDAIGKTKTKPGDVPVDPVIIQSITIN